MNVFGVVEKVDGDLFIIKVDHDDENIVRVKSSESKCDFLLREGDILQLTYNKTPKLEKIEANGRENDYEDQICLIFDGYGIIGNDTIFYFDDDNGAFSVGDTLTCDRIEGVYDFPENKEHAEVDIWFRCISFKKIKSAKKDKGYVAYIEKPKIHVSYTAFIEEPKKSKLRDVRGDISEEIKTLMMDVKCSENIRAKLDELIPTELNFSTYEKFFHCLIDLDELNLRKEFETYTKEAAAFYPKSVADNNKVSHIFMMKFEGLHEHRPSIMKGKFKRCKLHGNEANQ